MYVQYVYIVGRAFIYVHDSADLLADNVIFEYYLTIFILLNTGDDLLLEFSLIESEIEAIKREAVKRY